MEDSLILKLERLGIIPEADRPLIAAAFEQRFVKEGDVLFKGGRVCRELFFIEKGVLRIMATNGKDIEVTHYFTGEGRFCTILNSFTNEVPAHESIQAACNCEVLTISRSGLLALFEKFSYIKSLIDQALHIQLLQKIQLRNSYLGLDAMSRYRLFMQQQPDIAARVSLQDIASYLEITPQSLSRIRKNLL